MPIQVEWRDGQALPVVTCDHCAKPIQDAREGVAQWREPLERQRYATGRRLLNFTHKLCYPEFSYPKGGRTPGADWSMWNSQELSVFVRLLARITDADAHARPLARRASGD